MEMSTQIDASFSATRFEAHFKIMNTPDEYHAYLLIYYTWFSTLLPSLLLLHGNEMSTTGVVVVVNT